MNNVDPGGIGARNRWNQNGALLITMWENSSVPIIKLKG